MTTASADTPTFLETGRRLGALRQSMRALVASVPGGGSVQTGLDIERVVGLHRKLAWQVHRLCQSGDCVADARFLPSRVQFVRFVESAVSRGGNRDIGEGVLERYREIESFVETVCGSRIGFESMISDADRAAASDLTNKHREAMHDAACHLYGMRAAARFSCNVVAPGKGEELDYIHMDGLIGLHRQRGGGAWPVHRLNYRFSDAKGNWKQPERVSVFDEEAYRRLGVAIVPEYCSEPMPAFESVRVPDSDSGQILARFEDLGRQSAASLVFGMALRGADTREWVTNAVGSRAEFVVRIELPCEMLVHDVLVHESIELGTPRISTLRMDTDLTTFQVVQMETHTLPVSETVAEAGMGTAMLAGIEAIPRYADMLARCINLAGNPAHEYRAYRSVIRYPMVSTIVAMRFG